MIKTMTKLTTEESPREILSRDFSQKQWPISGGWGYTKNDAVVIEVENTEEGVELEYEFLQCRSYEEAKISQHEGQIIVILEFKTKMQTLLEDDNGKFFDYVVMNVTALSLTKEKPKRIQYEICGYFDISQFFGKHK